MFEALAERLLNSLLGEYIEDFSAENLKIGIWSGEVVLRNVVLRKSIVRKLNLPLAIIYSRLGCLRMNIPWKSLASSKIEVLLEGFELVLAELPAEEWTCKNTKIVEKRRKEIERFCEGVVADFAKKDGKGKEGEEGYFSRLVVRIIDNLQVTVKDIHIRFQDQLTRAYSFGLTLEEFRLFTVNASGQPQYIDRSRPEYAKEPLRKQLELYNIGIYWNEKSDFYGEEDFQARMGSGIARRGQAALQHNYVILMSSQATLLQREAGKQFVEPEVDLQIDLRTLRLEVTNTQLQQVITLAQRMQRYSRRVVEENRQQLSPQEARANLDFFARVFPDYYNGYGCNLDKAELQRLEQILEKMEVESFARCMTQHLQEREKERLVRERQEQKKGWWFGRPKQLTPQELQEIEAYLNDNFAQETPALRRPEDYHYLKVRFRLQRLQVAIANRLAILKEGIQASFDDLEVKLSLREGGYRLEVALEDIGVELFRQAGADGRESKPVLSKLEEFSSRTDSSYLRMEVVGNPLDKKYLNTQITLATSELLIVFDPKIIAIATEFADLKLSQENKEAALEKFGELKERTEAAVTETIDRPVKAQIGVDVLFNSVTLVVPFSPHRQERDCWALNLGVTHLTTDQETLRRQQASEGQPLDTFHLQLTDFSLRHFPSIAQLRQPQSTTSVTHSVIDSLSFRLRVDVFESASASQPKIKVQAVLPSLSVNLNQFTYSSLLRLGEAFAQEERAQQSRMTARIDEKKEIQQKAAKIGFVSVKDALTLAWKKYVAIMSENYIYLYLNKNDRDYAAFYYVKGATLDKYREPSDQQKPFHFRIKNKVNEVVFGFDKEEQIDDWIAKIKATSKEQEFLSQVLSTTATNALSGILTPAPKKQHDRLNLFIQADIQAIALKVFTSESLLEQVVRLDFAKLSTRVSLHQSKKRISLELASLELLDTLRPYRSKQLLYFLQTKRSSEAESLITLEIEQLNRDHPLYDSTDSAITLSFGSLLCNYKCETVKTLMAFFLPQPAEEEKPPSAILESEALGSTSFAVPIAEEIFSLKLRVRIREIAVTLVNEKVGSVLGTMGISDLQLFLGVSQRRTLVVGSLRDLFLIDRTNYPCTIHQEQQEYPQERTLLTANIGEDKNMMDFNIELLNEPNEYNKKLLVDVKIANLTAYYLQQPILRLITYLNTQLLPSLANKNSQKQPAPPNDAKPEPTTMQLNVELTNISVFVETEHQSDRQRQEFMQLNIATVTVRNDSMYRPYVRQDKPIVLVENYEVALRAMSIAVHYFDINQKEHRYKLTNSLDLTLSTDLIANPEFYRKEIPEMFLGGLRVRCAMTPFFMRLNHDDYNFIMKCLRWAITHDDGLEDLLFDPPAAQPSSQPAQQDPFYLTVSMDCISLFVTQNDLPIAFLLLDQLAFAFASSHTGSQMDLTMKSLYGTSIQYDAQAKTLSERGVFNSLGHSSQQRLERALDLQGFIDLFDRRDRVASSGKPDFLKCIITLSEDSTDIQVQLHELVIDVDVRLLMILSSLASTDEAYIKGPEPIRKRTAEAEPKGKPSSKKFTMLVEVKRLLGSVCDLRKEKFAIIQGGVALTMINYWDKSIEEIEERIRRRPVNDGIIHSTTEAALRNFTVYFSKIKAGCIVAKREFLRPMRIDLNLQRFYTKNRDIHILSTDIRIKTDELLLAASIKDALNVNQILQDNLAVLAEFQKGERAEGQGEGERAIQKLEESVTREIQSKTKIVGTIAPVQIEVINDCDNNFMPVLRLLLEDTSPAMHQTVIATQLFVVPILSLYFFNPRSSRWEPIIEPFKAAISYSKVTLNNQPSVSINITTDALSEATSSLKLNISTQMISTLIATRDIVRAEQANTGREEGREEGKDIEISPYLFHNLTNQRLFLLRGESEFELPPLFKGPIRLPKDKEVRFRMGNTTHKFSLDHYGVLRIPQSDYFIRFATEKLNRVIKFMALLVVKNKLQQPVFVRRFGRVSEVPVRVEREEALPLDGVESFAVSLNGSSYTERTRSDSVQLSGCLLAEKKNFVVLVKCKEKINRYTFVHLLPPFVIHNCLPKDLHLQFIQKARTKSTVSVQAQRSYCVFTSEDITSLQIKAYAPGYTWSSRFRYNPDHEEESHLRLEDEDNFSTVLSYVFKRERATNQFVLIIYCRKIIVNELHDKLLVYANFQEDERAKRPERFELLGGQKRDDDAFDDKVIMVGEEVGNCLRVCGAHSIFDFATPISTAGLGSSQSRIVVDRQSEGRPQSLFMTIGVEISAVKMMKECDIFCRKIVLRSRVIIANNSQLDLFLAEDQATQHRFLSQAGSRKNFVSGLPAIEGRHYRYIVTAQGFLPSKRIHLPAQGSVFFRLRSAERLDKSGKRVELYFKIYVQEVERYSFYEISQISADELPYELRVASERLRATVPALNLHASKAAASRFLNESESEERFEVEVVIEHSDSKEELRVRVCPDDLRFRQKELMRVERAGLLGSVAVVVEVTISDKQRSILVKELAREEEQQEVQQSAMVVELKEIIISVNQNSQSVEVPYESFVITLQRLCFIKLQTDKRQQYQLKLGFLQIDQGFPFLISSPVILTPHKYELFTREKDPKSIFNFTIVFSKQFVRNTFISEICVDFDDIVATFSADFITLAMAISAEFGEVINYKENTYLLQRQEEGWQGLKLPAQGNNVFIRSIKIAPFVIDLSAELNIKKLNLQNNLLLTTIMSTFGIVISNIDNAPFEMSGIEISDCIDTVPSITAKLLAHYKRTCINQLYKVFGSLNILGNPLNLFRNISTGVRDLREKPAQGFVNGPAEFGLGIVEGTGSFVAHSVGGAFNSISKVTGTVSSGLATLAFDKEFQEHREKERMKKPQNVIQGLEKGGKAIFYGFKEGITGVWMQPIENAKKEGALGFVKGAAKGLAGLVIKPVTGIIDFASKTTEGIKNNALIFEDKARESRMRYPRVFYTECLILKEYSARDSQLFSILKKMDNEERFQNAIFIDAFEAVDGHDYLVILQSGIVYIDLAARKVRWSVEFCDLQLEDNRERRTLQFKKRGKAANFFNVDYEVAIEQDELRAIVAELILTLQKERQEL